MSYLAVQPLGVLPEARTLSFHCFQLLSGLMAGAWRALELALKGRDR